MTTITELKCWKKTAIGTPIPLFSSEPLDKLVPKRPILLFGGVHGDEPEGVRLAQDTLGTLLTLTNSTLDATDIVPWVIIPCLNVDGRQKGTRVNARGVDLNRNYPSRDWSPHADKPRYNPGPHPMSEPETAGIVELIEQLNPQLLIHCHSWKPCIVATGPKAQKDGERLARSSQYQLIDEIGYPTPGSLSSYGWHDKSIPVICIEEQEHMVDIATIWPRFQTGMMEIFLDDEHIKKSLHHIKN